MSTQGFTIFDTAIGRCAIAWGEGGVIGVKLPERSDAALRASIARQHPDARETDPPPAIDAAIAEVVGDSPDLVAGASPEVRTCGDYEDDVGHLVEPARSPIGDAIGQFYDAGD